MRHNESKLQQACVRWFRYQYPTALICAIPNGGYRSPIEAKIMKSEGVTAGMPDLLICLPYEKTLFVELKTEKGNLTECQEVMHERLRKLGYGVHVVRSIDDFKCLIDEEVNQ